MSFPLRLLLADGSADDRTAQDAESRYRSLFENVPIGLYRVRSDGPAEDCNRALVELLGYPDKQSLLQVDPGELFADLRVAEQWRDQILREGVARNFEMQLRRQDGSLVWVSHSAHVVRDANGEVLCYEGSVEDISARKRAEERQETLSQMAIRLAAASSTKAMVTVVREATERLFDWDAHYFAVRRPPEENFRVLAFFDTLGGQRRALAEGEWPAPNLSSPVRQVLAGKPSLLNREPGASDPELRRFGDLSRPSASLMHAPVRSGDEVIGVLSVQSYQHHRYGEGELHVLQRVADTVAPALERVNAEEARRESEERYRSLVETSPDAITLTDLNLNIVVTNQQAAALHGFDSIEELLGTNALDLIAPEDRERAVENSRKALETGGVRQLEYAVIRKDGSRVPIELSASVIAGPDGQPKAFIGVTRDISQRKQAQQALEQHGRLAAVGQLAAGIAHDFNNLLTSVVGFAQLLLLRDDVSEFAKERIRAIEAQGLRAAELTRQILDFGRRSLAQRRPLELGPLLRETATLLERTIPESIRVGVEGEPGNHFIRADPTQIQQILTNLALNARDAMPDGGKLELRLSRFRLRSGEPAPLPEMDGGEWVVLTVSDTGTGMSGEVIEHVFEPFFTTKEVGQGSGLGLAQVYGIVKQHDGHIKVESQPGKGARFTMYFPALSVGDEPVIVSARFHAEKTFPKGFESVMVAALSGVQSDQSDQSDRSDRSDRSDLPTDSQATGAGERAVFHRVEPEAEKRRDGDGLHRPLLA